MYPLSVAPNQSTPKMSLVDYSWLLATSICINCAHLLVLNFWSS